jgi:LysM repeat protein
MRILKYALILLGLLMLIPLAAAQENTGRTIILEEDTSFETLFEEYGCPIGIRDANRSLEFTSAGLIRAGQSISIPNDTILCSIEYTGEIRYFDWYAYYRVHRYPNTTWEFAAFFNVCEETLDELNPRWRYQGYMQSVRIPLDASPCFETVELAAGQSPHDLAQELNICEGLLWYYNNVDIYEPSTETREVFIPLDYQPCYLDGQVLMTQDFNDREGYYVPAERIELEEATRLRDYAIAEGYCYFDIEPVNRGKSPGYFHYNNAQLEEVYIPEGARRCQYETIDATDADNIVALAYERNVCLESLIDVNHALDSWEVFGSDARGIWIPEEAPCYDENGLRIGKNDRAVHETSKDDWLYGIAQQYEVCMADLYAANPLLADYPYADLPSLVFIPDTPPCSDIGEDGYIQHVMRDGEIYTRNAPSLTYRNVGYIYNVCELELIKANPQMILNWPENPDSAYSYELQMPAVGDVLLIPTATRPCYDYDVPMMDIGHYRHASPYVPTRIEYVCYAQEIDLNQDYTGHEPAISPVPMQDDSYCYDRLANPVIILNNVRYTIYPAYAEVYFFDIADCFGVNAYELVPITYEEMGIERDFAQNQGFWGIPNPTQDCPLIGDDYNTALNWLNTKRHEVVFGTLNEAGEYGVQEGDTLSSIGREYGYLPEWIMAENGMPDDTIYIRQTLRLPKYPNLYQLATYGGAIGGGVVLLLLGRFALMLRAKGRKGKKKNDE